MEVRITSHKTKIDTEADTFYVLNIEGIDFKVPEFIYRNIGEGRILEIMQELRHSLERTNP